MVKGFIPKNYVPDLNQRLDFYRRIQIASEHEECLSITSELADRYGPYPEAVAKLLAILEIRIFCQQIHISKIEMKLNHACLYLLSSTLINTEKLTSVLDDRFSIRSEYEINIRVDRKGWKTDLMLIRNYLKKLATLLKTVKV